MAFERRDQLIKVSIVSSAKDIEAVVWRRRRPLVMSEQDVDDVAFLTGRTDHLSKYLCKHVSHLYITWRCSSGKFYFILY